MWGKEYMVFIDVGLGLLEKLVGVIIQYVMLFMGIGVIGELLGVSSELSGWCVVMIVYEGI